MKCFYHGTDFDGKCSAAIVKYFHPECELYPITYKDQDNFDFNLVFENETIYIVDFSFSAKKTEKLAEITNLIWIDHHKSAIQRIDALEYANKYKIPFLHRKTEIGKAGCELTWEHFQEKENAGKMPLAVHLLGRYDVFDHTDSKTLPFQYGIRSVDLFNQKYWDQEVWNSLFENENFVANILDRGTFIYEYQCMQNRYLCNNSFESDFMGYNCICINGIGNSLIFNELENKDEYDIFILFTCKKEDNKTVYKYTLFSNSTVDVSEIAEKFNGGGHKGAAGFYSEDFVL